MIDDLAEVVPRSWRASAVRIGVMVVAGVLLEALILSQLLPTWHDARFAAALVLGHSAREINEEALNAPLPPLGRGVFGPIVLPPGPGPPNRLIGPPPDFSEPEPAGPGGRYAQEFAMQRLQREWYAREYERHQRREAER